MEMKACISGLVCGSCGPPKQVMVCPVIITSEGKQYARMGPTSCKSICSYPQKAHGRNIGVKLHIQLSIAWEPQDPSCHTLQKLLFPTY